MTFTLQKLLMDGRNHLSWRKAAQANERDNWGKAVARTVARTLPSQKGRKMCGPQSPLPADNLSSISRFLNPKGFLQPPSHLRQQANQSDVLRKPIWNSEECVEWGSCKHRRLAFIAFKCQSEFSLLPTFQGHARYVLCIFWKRLEPSIIANEIKYRDLCITKPLVLRPTCLKWLSF